MENQIQKEQNQQTAKRFCSTTEAANFYNVTPATIRNWNKRGILKGYRFGGRLRFTLEQLDKLLIEN